MPMPHCLWIKLLCSRVKITHLNLLAICLSVKTWSSASTTYPASLKIYSGVFWHLVSPRPPDIHIQKNCNPTPGINKNTRPRSRYSTYVTSSQHSNVQVKITVTCLNFAVTGSRILLHPLSSSRRGKPSRKIALNSNREVNCRELARRPWPMWETLSGTNATGAVRVFSVTQASA